MRYLAITLLLLIACSRVNSTDATLENLLAVDGCAYVLVVGSQRLGVDESSRERVNAVAGNRQEIPVRVSYTELGQPVEVPCGFGGKSALPGVTVHWIERR